MNPEQLDEYINRFIKPALEEYAKKRNITIEELLLETTYLEDTGLFNYKNHQSTVYNRLHDNNITTLKELFKAHDNNEINYGKNELKSNNNYYIHNEIKGIISLLKYKYLGIVPQQLQELLNYKINTNYYININPYHKLYTRHEDVLYSITRTQSIDKKNINIIHEFYMILKSCGFNQVGTKTLIDLAYEKNINNISLGEFLSELSLEDIQKKFSNTPQELKPFLNILNIIKDFYHNHYQPIPPNNKKY